MHPVKNLWIKAKAHFAHFPHPLILILSATPLLVLALTGMLSLPHEMGHALAGKALHARFTYISLPKSASLLCPKSFRLAGVSILCDGSGDPCAQFDNLEKENRLTRGLIALAGPLTDLTLGALSLASLIRLNRSSPIRHPKTWCMLAAYTCIQLISVLVNADPHLTAQGSPKDGLRFANAISPQHFPLK